MNGPLSYGSDKALHGGGWLPMNLSEQLISNQKRKQKFDAGIAHIVRIELPNSTADIKGPESA